MLNYGIGATKGKKATGTKKKTTRTMKSAPAATALPVLAKTVKAAQKKVSTAKKKVVAAEKAVEELKSFQKRRLKAGRWKSYGTANQVFCSTAGKLLRKSKTTTAGKALRKCR